MVSKEIKPFLKRAKLITDNNFHLDAYGHFCLSVNEFAYILYLSEQKNANTLLKNFYDKLSFERLP